MKEREEDLKGTNRGRDPMWVVLSSYGCSAGECGEPQRTQGRKWWNLTCAALQLFFFNFYLFWLLAFFFLLSMLLLLPCFLPPSLFCLWLLFEEFE